MPTKKSPPNKHPDYVSVLIVDDNKMARSAWKKILQHSGQVKIVGEFALSEIPKKLEQIEPPEVIVAGNSYAEKGFLHNAKIKAIWGYYPKTLIICDKQQQVPLAFKAHADLAVYKPFDDQELVTWVRMISDEAKRLCEEYYGQLISNLKKKKERNNHLKLIQSILQLLFHPDLVNPESVDIRGVDGLSNDRLVFRNQAKKERKSETGVLKFDEFWEDMRQDHNAKYIPIDIYDSEIPKQAISKMGSYLTSSHGSFGLVIGHKKDVGNLHLLQLAQIDNENKIILLLDYADLQETLEYKAGGINPACLLKNQYQQLVIKAGQ